MRASHLAIFGLFTLSACSGSTPSTPSPSPPPAPATFVISGTVYQIDAAGRRPLIAAMVDIADSTTGIWGQYGRPMTDGNGRYVSLPLTARHYLARASKAGFESSSAVSLGYIDAARTVDFELVAVSATTAPLSVTAISPSTGSTGGGTTVRITGTGFQPRATVTFGGESGTAYVENSSVISVTSPARAAGAVDVVVTNPDSQVAKLAGAYTYAPPTSFDFNGTWVGAALAHPESETRVTISHADMDFRLTIQNNVVTAVSCGGVTIAMPSPAPSVTNGEFSLAEASMTGRILAAAEAGGAVNTPACPATRWNARRQ